MKILVTGATGLIGGAVARRLAHAGHEIHALARSDASAVRLAAQGYATVRGDLTSADVLRDAAAAADAVVHAASPGDASSAVADEVATDAILDGLRGSSKRFIYTSGSLLYGATGDMPATEDSPLAPVDLVRFRKRVEARVLGAATEGVHAIAIRPGWVYGHGGGTAMMMVASAAQHGAARCVGEGLNRWTNVHVDDLADLYLLALERAPAGAVFNGVHGEATPLIDIARAASVGGGAGGRVDSWPLEDARESLNAFADAIACDQVVSGELAVRELGWRPAELTILNELRSYAATEA